MPHLICHSRFTSVVLVLRNYVIALSPVQKAWLCDFWGACSNCAVRMTVLPFDSSSKGEVPCLYLIRNLLPGSQQKLV